jgi:hypothetical protein
MRRWLLRILTTVAALLALAIIGVQAVLWSNLPRQIVLDRLESQLHLRVSIGSVSTGWLGNATLRNVAFSLPLGDQPVLQVKTVQAKHTSVFGLLIGRDFQIDRLDLQQAELRLTRGPGGRWNYQQFADLMASPATKTPGASVVSLPDIHAADATVSITDGPRRCVIENVTLDGAADSALTWKFTLDVPGHAHLIGRLVPGLDWQHEVDAQLSDVAGWVGPWLKFPADASFDGTWHGSIVEGQLRGRLQVGQAVLAGSQASGGIDLSLSNGTINLHPDSLRIRTPYAAVKEITAVRGSVTYQNQLIRADDVHLLAYGGPATIGGSYDFAAQSGQIQAAWDGLALPGGIVHGGNLTASVRRPFPKQWILQGTIFSFASTPQAPWRAQLNFGAQTDGDSDASWHVNASELAWQRRNPIRLDGLQLFGTVHRVNQGPPTIALTSATLADSNAMSGSGFYNATDRSWALTLQGDRWPIQLMRGASIGFDMDARGNSSLVELKHFGLHQAETSLSASGFYYYGVPKPLHIGVIVSSRSADGLDAASPAIVGGAVRGKIDLGGTLLPLNVDVGGELDGHNVSVAGRWLGDVVLRLSGGVNPQKAEVRTERLRALDGDWYLRGTYTFAEELLDADLRVGGLPLNALGGVTQTRGMQGVVDGEWDAYILSLPLSAQKIRLRGGGSVRDFRTKLFAADQIDFTTTMDDGVLQLDPITLHCQEGQGTAAVSWNVNAPRHLNGAIALADWPVNVGQVNATVKLDLPELNLDLPQPATTQSAPESLQIFTSAAQMQMAVRWKDRPIGQVLIAGDSDGRTATVRDLSGTLLGANLHGSGVYDLDAPLAMRGSLELDEMETARIVELMPQLAGLTGRLHGAATLGPATAAHPLEPLALGMAVQFDDAHYRGVPIGLLNLNLFMNTDRVVLDDRPGHGSTLDVAQGQARFWARRTNRSNEVSSSQAEIQLDKLNLDQIVHAADPKMQPTPGLLSGRVMFLYNSPLGRQPVAVDEPGGRAMLRQLMADLYGEATLNITHSDIATVPIISDLYTLMSLGQASRGSIGTGAASVRLENGTLHLEQVRYSNRGIDARIQLTSPQMWDFPRNPVSGVGVGSAQPLAALKLPLVADVQTALTAVQNNFTPVQISGTWNNIHTDQIAFKAVGDAMRQFLVGDIGGEDNSSGNN